jgi:predicted aspartyl protease
MTTAYDTSAQPPAPFLEFEVVSPQDPTQRRLAQALLDTGAEVSVLPAEILTALQIPKASNMSVESWDGAPTLVTTYVVILGIADTRLDSIEVVAAPMSYAILGRDVLNHFILTLNGKDLSLELEDP